MKLCEHCQKRLASVYVSLFENRAQSHAYCDECAEQVIRLSKDIETAGLRWTLYGAQTEGLIHVHFRILKVGAHSIIARIINSSHYPPGTELMLRRDFLPASGPVEGEDFRFTCAPEQLESLIAR